MADPVIAPCPANAWTKVATNVTSGAIWILSISPGLYLQTYRATGGAAPATVDDGVQFEVGLKINALAGVDVYIYAQGKDGSVRVDL